MKLIVLIIVVCAIVSTTEYSRGFKEGYNFALLLSKDYREKTGKNLDEIEMFNPESSIDN